ncbi:heme peroxidase [Podospora didyma]|uniref:Peroxidase n=1 Tax=Podospora didyma TaxID=330526 RepID=A0AAE0NYA2_9PEZI|nr:heme peroxidase [Podospora didyma]
MSTLKLTLFSSIFLLVSSRINTYTWPDPKTDILEAIYYQQSGYDGRRFGFFVRSCDIGAGNIGPGRTNSAEWVRTAYHDMATADVEAGTGGMDASIGFERDRPENVGRAFTDTLLFFEDFMSVHSSMADLIALGAVMSITACTASASQRPIYLSFRGGRIDATGPGPLGVPEPHQDLATHINSFKKQGFNVTEMIALVACGHSLGGVNGRDFPEIVSVKNDSTNIESKRNFDTTQTVLDNNIALFQRMIDTVPKTVQLSGVIAPISVKPNNIFIAVKQDGNMTITGDIRTTTGWHPYSPAFECHVLSSFTVEVIDDGQSTVYTNGGAGFPIQTDIIPQAGLSCGTIFLGTSYSLNLTVAVRDDFQLQQVILTIPIPIQQAGSIVPRFELYIQTMQRTKTLNGTGYSFRGGLKDIGMPFQLWKGLGSCSLD